ncbi:PQQ-binding-like beta-propeller repeat protein [Aurantimonas endophytica]|uniref:Quinoprotein glucose dehydrogenase n=1 Tax=Aurantimonas endophytica TaxID=1522175 RepID=A0A7W6HDY2_9HYPH|nr:PQQ-binding-like beta-propeller repeat protein [Aurantimonas endophytica]MBB4003307.1 quinoprotein glucose dehydrogenase [Aurantimonas endophytica]MCO6404168.1 PQQ-binding-like beta-propeller repeat protein [Aurantimonas endophytica]
MRASLGSIVALIAICLLALIGLALTGGGIWLLTLGGSWYYLVCGIAFLATAALVFLRRPEALIVFALVVVGTLIWALYEVGFDWWPLAARGGLVFLLGLLLLTPWVTRRLGTRNVADALDGRDRRPTVTHGAGAALSAALGIALVVAVSSWFSDQHNIVGSLPGPRAEAPTYDIPDGEWHAYGRTQAGQRYSPLAQITPANVGDLEEAWHYHTGDESQPGDPTETTFQVTPLKIGDRLFLCTPHQNVIAVNATTGEEIWRYDPQIQGELALQHLTCRGLSYQPPGDATAAAAPTAVPDAAATEAPDAATPAGATPPAAAADTEQAGEGEAPAATATELSQGGNLTAPQTGGEAETDQPVSPEASAGQPVAATTSSRDTATCDAKLFMPTADARVIALDPETGAVCGNFGNGTGQIDLWQRMPNVNPGSYYSTSPVIVAGNLIIVGGTVLDNVSTSEASGVIRAFDIATAELVWAWDSGNPDQTAPLPEGQTYTPNSPNSWSISAADEELGLVYVPLGNEPPDQWGPDRSEAVERFSSSVVALDIATGEVRWVYQTVHHDLWDFDVPSQPSLLDITVGGESVPVLVQPTKQGEVFVLDRRTGEPVLPVIEKPAPGGAVEPDFTAPTQPVSALSFDPQALRESDMWGATMLDQLACRIAFRGYKYEGRYTPPSLEGTLVYPGNFGVFNWGSVAVDPVRQVMFSTPAYLAFVSTLVPRDDETSLVVNDEQPEGALPALNENFGAPYAVELAPFTSWLGLPCQAPPWGYVAGADLTTGEIVWMHKNGTVRDQSPIPVPFKMGVPDLGGPVMTAGGVAFISGTLDYYVRGYDVTTGKELWKARLPAGGQATPMSYEGADGRQYILVAAGGHGSLGTKRGDSVIAYALPDRSAEADAE